MNTNHHTPLSNADTANATNLNAPLSSLDSAISNVISGAQAITPDINGGTIDNAAIGGTTPAAVAATTLSASGAVSFTSTFSLGGKIYVHRNSVAQTIANNTATTVQFNVETLDESSWFNTGTYQYTPQIAGYYVAHAQITWAAGVDATISEVYITFNGGGVAYNYSQASGTGTHSQQVLIFYNMNGSTDYFSVGCSQQSGGHLNIDGNPQLSWFRVFRIG